MQLNFLQEDLLAAIQKESASVPTNSLQRSAVRRAPVQQASLLDDLPPPLVKQPKPVVVSAPAPVDETKSSAAFRTISEAAEALDVPAYVLRFWEGQFPQIKPTKSRGGRRYYRPEDMEILVVIKTLLYQQGYTIKGARKALQYVKHGVKRAAQSAPVMEQPAAITPRQKVQLAAIRAELLDLQQHLTPYL